MKKIIQMLLVIGSIISISFLTACGGLHNSGSIGAVNLITGKSIKIKLDVYDYADTGNFSNFSTKLNFSELQKELENSDAVKSVINIYHNSPSQGYMKLDTDSGDFYIKLNSSNDGGYSYSLFADVGKATDFGEYIYIPFHMLDKYSNSDCPANATPFQGEIFYNKFFDYDDFAEYYTGKGIYDVKKSKDKTTLLITNKNSGYAFCIKMFDDDGSFFLHEEYRG